MNIIGAVLVRPQMYTLSGSFGEIIAFLEGYISGVAHHHPQVEVVEEWAAFREWLSQHTHTPLSDVFIDMWKQREDDEAVVTRLRQLYHEFKGGEPFS